MIPTCIYRLQVNLANPGEARWLGAALSRECQPFGASLQPSDGGLLLEWPHAVEPIA